MATAQSSSRRRSMPKAESGATVASEGKRARNKREKRDRIVVAARALFHEQGFAVTTTQQIARSAGIGAGTLFLYAKSKEDLLILVFTTEMHALIERAYAGIDSETDIGAQTLALFRRFIAYHARDVELAHQLIREITFLRHRERAVELRAISHAIVDRLVRLLERAVARRELRSDTDLSALASCLFAIYYQQLQTWLAGYTPRRSFQRTLEGMVTFLIDRSRVRR